MFYGAPRPYTHAALGAGYHQITTIAHSKHAAAWKWYPVSALSEMLRGWGKIRILARWDHKQPFDGAAVAFCHHFIHLLAKQDFPQDWIFDIRSTTTSRIAIYLRASDNTFTFFLAMSHLDMNNVNTSEYFSHLRSKAHRFPDCKPLLYQVVPD